MVIIKDRVYHEIIDLLNNYQGLALDCENEIFSRYSYIPEDSIRSIIAKQQRNVIKSFFGRFSSKPDVIVEEYRKRAFDDTAIMSLAAEIKVPPTSVARMILNELYSKTNVKLYLKNPDMIPDPILSANVYNCILNDSQDSVVVDMLRYCIGEEYEVKLKKLASDANLIYYDENDLRRVGYDKTPDLLTVPFLYKNTIVNWIESKAMFSDVETHMTYFKQQLSCYENRFGTGIVIYWFGFQEAVLNTKSNIIILDDFPEKQYLTTLQHFDVK